MDKLQTPYCIIKGFNNQLSRKVLKGFTLAEVLITLAVVGVLAAMTVPAIVQIFKELRTESMLKHFYSNFSQALKLKMANDGCTDLTCSGFDGGMTNVADGKPLDLALIDLATNYLKINKYIDAANFSSVSYKALDGGVPTVWYGAADPMTFDIKFFMKLSDGIKVGLLNYWDTCNRNSRNGECMYVYVDLNGDKLPNQYGVDTFQFTVFYDGKIKGDTRYLNDCLSSAETAGRRSGHGCTNRILNNSWQIDYWH